MAAAKVPSASNFPLGAPPPGFTPNFEHPQNHDGEMTVGVVACASLIFSFCALRIWAKTAGYMKKTWNDVLFGFAVLFTAAHIGLNYELIVSGPFGKHLYELLIMEFTKNQLLTFHSNLIIWTVAIFLIKLSLLVFYLEIFGRLRWMRILAYVGMVFLFLCHFPFLVAFGLLCAPKSGATSTVMVLESWLSNSCRQITPRVVISQGVFDVLSDIFLFVLPLPAIHSLQLPRKPKIGILFMFLTGFGAIVASGIGLYYRVFVSLSWADANWLDASMSLVTMIEITAGLAILCMPAVVAVAKKSTVSAKLRSYTARSTWRGSRGSRDANEKSFGSSNTSGSPTATMTGSTERLSSDASAMDIEAQVPTGLAEQKAMQTDVHELDTSPNSLDSRNRLSTGSTNMTIVKSMEYRARHEV